VHTKYHRTASVLGGVLITTLVGAAGASGQQPPENQVGAVVDAFHAALAAGESVEVEWPASSFPSSAR